MSTPPEPEQMSKSEQVMDPLLGAIINAQFGMTRDVTDRLVEGLQYDVLYRRCVIELMREGVYKLINGPYVPATHRIARAMHPSEESIRERMKQYQEER